jgi:hypothetical protein
VPAAIALLPLALSRPEREAVLFTVRDLVVLILVGGVLLWLWHRLTRK